MSVFKPFNCLKPCRHGTMLFNTNDSYVGRSLDLYGEYCEREISVFRQVLQPGMVAVEVGANLGAHTVFLAQAVGLLGRVIAFEPQRIVFQALCANVALNHITNVDCRHAAVGKAAGQLLVPPVDYLHEGNFGGLSLGQYSQGERVPVTTLDSLELLECAMIKIDVEGMESDVLEGARATIARCQPLLYVENDRREKSANLVRLIDSMGYDMYWHRPALFNPDNFAANPNNVFGAIVASNMICCPQGGKTCVKGFRPVELPPRA